MPINNTFYQDDNTEKRRGREKALICVLKARAWSHLAVLRIHDKK
jgi:hypothetical protein